MTELFENFEVNRDSRWAVMLARLIGASLVLHLVLVWLVIYVPAIRDTVNIAALIASTEFVDRDYVATQIGDDVQLLQLTNEKFRYPDGYFALEAQLDGELPPQAGAAADPFAPVYLPAGGASVAPFATLFGRPVIPSEYTAKLGTGGDIQFVDMSEYLYIEKGGIQSASSMHVRFIYDEMTFRFVYRVDGQPAWSAPLTPRNGSLDTVSPFVILAT